MTEESNMKKIASNTMLAAFARIMVTIGTPILIAAVLWCASAFTQMREDIITTKTVLLYMKDELYNVSRRVTILEAKTFGIPILPERSLPHD